MLPFGQLKKKIAKEAEKFRQKLFLILHKTEDKTKKRNYMYYVPYFLINLINTMIHERERKNVI